MNPPVVSIVVVNYNGLRHLEGCLLALLDNSDVPFELIVVDNASTDGSVDGLEKRFASVTVIRSDANLGYAGGINLGARRAHGQYLAILNMDVIVRQCWLSPLVRFLEEHPWVGAVTPCIMLYDRPGCINALGQNVHVSSLGFNRKLDSAATEIDPVPVRVGGVQGGSFVMRLDTFNRLGGMNEAYFLYHEDVELSLRLALAGYEIFVVPASVVGHKYALHMTAQKLHWLERHRWLTLLETFHWSTILALAPFLVFTELMMFGYCLSRGRQFLVAKWRAMGWVISHPRELQECRRRAQSVRCVSDWQVLSSLRWRYDSGQFLTLARQRGGWINEAVSGLFPRRPHDRTA